MIWEMFEGKNPEARKPGLWNMWRAPIPVTGWKRWWPRMVRASLGILLMHSLTAAQSGGGAQASSGPYEATPQRPTFTSDTSTTAPGTLELEVGTTSWRGFFALPVTVKYTPDVGRGLFHRAEFSLTFDALTSVEETSRRATRFGDRLGFAVRRPVYRGETLSVAVVPQALFFLRGDRGARLGLTGIMVYGMGLNSLTVNGTWTSATHPSATNPAQQYDVAVDVARTLGESGPRSRWTVFGGLLYENPSHRAAAVSLGQGVTYRFRPNWVLDFAVRQLGLAAGRRDYQILAGFTVNLGRPSDW